MVKITPLIIIICIASCTKIFCKTDNTPPSGIYSQPEPQTLITSDQVRFQVLAEDKESGIKQVSFYAVWAKKGSEKKETHLIGIDSIKPYEVVWNCEEAPDAQYGRDNLYCLITDNSGNQAKIIPDDLFLIILDRHAEVKSITFKSRFISKEIRIDGKLADWEEQDSFISLQGSDNKVRAVSCWNSDFLYFAVTVKDKYLYESDYAHFYKSYMFPQGLRPVWESDCIELSFDLDHNHNILPDFSDRELIISANGALLGNSIDVKNRKGKVWGHHISCSVSAAGTINDFSDIDTGYTVEIAIPWKTTGLAPRNGLTMGFDLFNSDYDEPKGQEVLATWSGVRNDNNDNPSEWGNLVLVKRTGIAFYLLLIPCFIILIILIVKRKQPKDSDNQQKSRIAGVAAYTKAHASDPNLTLQQIADHFHLTKAYLGSLFKSETGVSFAQFLNNVRIESAKDILKTTEKPITQVSFDSGYNSLEHFIRVFKARTNTSPLEFRKKYTKV